LSGTRAAARRLLNFTTYYEMKERAGTVGRVGGSQLLRAIRSAAPTARLHLVGHSFGARLVTAAANELAPQTSGVTLTLLQAAFSHNGLASKFDGTHDGAFRRIVSEARVSGPILITHTKNDRAVGVAYPLASRLARQKAAALGDENDPYGGLGRNGAQHTPEVETGELLGAGKPYSFTPGAIYNLRADRFIADHGDIASHAIAYALLSSIAAS
jgi:esterase/lipase superfamily enzyme